VQWVSLAGADTVSVSQRLNKRVRPRILRPVDHPDNRADEDRLLAELFDRNGGVIFLDGAVFEHGTRYTAPRPGWISWVGCSGGQFDRKARCYRVAADAPQYTGSVRIAFRPDEAPPVIQLTVDAVQEGYLYVQLMDGSGKVVCNNLTGKSILTGSRERERVSLEVPLRDYPDAAVLVLHRYHGPMELYRVFLAPAESGTEQG